MPGKSTGRSQAAEKGTLTPYTITRTDLGSIKDVEMAFGTQRLLPPWEEIPESFKGENIYTQVIDALCFDRPLPKIGMIFLEGFEDEQAASDLNRCVRAHIQSFGPNHEHKVAGLAYLMSKVCKIQS